ncbi:hypothetical protein BWK59_05535 [Flavobacterium davisii]|uniref:Uncharacterized protein n=1 Tax=Flavobacterium davisii TaxID=2906077 RepID=A0A246GL54_9FLAO|nr:hypothetical protein [Flavobacterium davisii]OWP84390.1 hypothetical protein BWK59_05535 [Flavobacterium davisii]
MDISQKILGKRVTRIYHNYIDKSLLIYFDEDLLVHFYECAIVFDLGIVGHKITYASHSGTLGISFELKKIGQDPDDYKCIIFSRDIKDYENKNEMVISYKNIKTESTKGCPKSEP